MIKLRTRKTGKTKGHNHTAILDAKNDGKTVAKNRDHVHIVKNGIVVEKNEHTHTLKI